MKTKIDHKEIQNKKSIKGIKDIEIDVEHITQTLPLKDLEWDIMIEELAEDDTLI